MAAYVVIFRDETTDPEEMRRYGEIAATAPNAKLKVVAAKTNRFQILEGDAAEAVVVLEFPCWDDALEWYESEQYTAAKAHRFRGARTRMALVDGVA